MSHTSDVPSSDSDTHELQGRRLLVSRIVWLTLATTLLVNFILSVPAYYGQLLTLCTSPQTVNCTSFQPTAGTLRSLHQLEMPLHFYAVLYILVIVAVSLVYMAVGALIFWRKSNHWWGLFFSFVLVLLGSFGVDSTLILDFVHVPTNPPPELLLVVVLLVCLNWGLLGAFLLTFPTGRFTPGWTAVLVLLWEFQVVLFITSVISIAPTPLFAVEFLLTWGSVSAVQVYRYRHVYTPVQRQQTKWVVFAYSLGVVVNVVSLGVGALVPRLGATDSPYQLLVNFLSIFVSLLIPLSIGIAILRYRLWDIDTIINRALVYGSLTGLLGALYAVLIVGLQGLTHLVVRQSSQPIVLVISTLVIAALFLPLRRRLQGLIDRRFYRHKYDAEKTLAAFSAALQSEVDLQEISVQLVAAVQETMQPERVSLWLWPSPTGVPRSRRQS
jgi:hypothetical protein